MSLIFVSKLKIFDIMIVYFIFPSKHAGTKVLFMFDNLRFYLKRSPLYTANLWTNYRVSSMRRLQVIYNEAVKFYYTATVGKKNKTKQYVGVKDKTLTLETFDLFSNLSS